MTKEELFKATTDELIEQLDYCGYDGYYNSYRADIIAEIKRRLNKVVPCSQCEFGVPTEDPDVVGCSMSPYDDQYKPIDWFCPDGQRRVSRNDAPR